MDNIDKHKYDYMLHMPYNGSKRHKHMPILDRAAQFGAFRALTGYQDAIDETKRITEKKIELDEYRKDELDIKLNILADNVKKHPVVTITHFVPDSQKEGGKYVETSGTIEKIYISKKKILFTTGEELSIENITDISGDIFNCLDYI